MTDPVERLSPLLTGLGVLLAYLAAPSFQHNFDGVACAIAVELGDLKHLVHGNHVLYGLAGFAFHRACQRAGLALSALWALQVLDSALGAAGAAMFQAFLLRSGFPARLAVLCSLGLAVSYGYWLWSLEAQVYLLSLVLLLFVLNETQREEPSPYRLAFWHAAAVMAHIANVLFAPAALYALWRKEDGRRAAVGKYLAALSALVLAGYCATALLFVRPEDVGQIKLWLLGSAALGPGRSFLWHSGGPWQNLSAWAGMSLRVVSVRPFLALPLWLAAARTLRGCEERHRRLAVLAWLWLGAYALLYLNWEPWTMVYRVADLVPLWILAAVAMRPWLERLPGRLLAAVYVAVLGAANLAAGVLPAGRAQNNPRLQEAVWLRANTPESAWVVAGGIDQVYVPYFAHRRTMNLAYFEGREEGFFQGIEAVLAHGERVYVSSWLLDQPGWRQKFSPLRLGAAAPSGAGTVYRVLGVDGPAQGQQVK